MAPMAAVVKTFLTMWRVCISGGSWRIQFRGRRRGNGGWVVGNAAFNCREIRRFTNLKRRESRRSSAPPEAKWAKSSLKTLVVVGVYARERVEEIMSARKSLMECFECGGVPYVYRCEWTSQKRKQCSHNPTMGIVTSKSKQLPQVPIEAVDDGWRSTMPIEDINALHRPSRATCDSVFSTHLCGTSIIRCHLSLLSYAAEATAGHPSSEDNPLNRRRRARVSLDGVLLLCRRKDTGAPSTLQLFTPFRIRVPDLNTFDEIRSHSCVYPRIILSVSSKMRVTLSLFVLCVAVSHAVVHTTPVSSIPPTGFFTPLLTAEPPCYFELQSGFYYEEPINAMYLCDGSEDVGGPCMTYQVLLYTNLNHTFLLSRPINITLVKTPIVQIPFIPGTNYTSPVDVFVNVTSSKPYNGALKQSGRQYIATFTASLFSITRLSANTTLSMNGFVNPMYVTSLPKTFSFEVFDDGLSFVYENVSYGATPLITSSQKILLVTDGTNNYQVRDSLLFSLKWNQTLLPGNGNYVDYLPTGSYNVTAMSYDIPASFIAYDTGIYNVTCETVGNSSDRYALVKLNGTREYEGYFYDNFHGTQVVPVNCRGSDTFSLEIHVNGPYEKVDAKFDQLTPLSDIGFYDMNVPANVTLDPLHSEYLTFVYPYPTCPNTNTSFKFFGYNLFGTFSHNFTFNVPAHQSVFFIQPPQGYCLRGEGIPSNSTNDFTIISNVSSFFYEDGDAKLFTLTCISDVLYVYPDVPAPMTITFTLVPIDGQGVYGETYDVDGLFILQYPPLTASTGVLSINTSGSLDILRNVVTLEQYRNSAKRAVIGNDQTMDAFRTKDFPLYRFMVAVLGRGRFSVDLGTNIGVNVGYDTNYHLNPTSTSSSSTMSGGGDATRTPTDGGAGAGGISTMVVPIVTANKPVSDALIVKATVFSAAVLLALFLQCNIDTNLSPQKISMRICTILGIVFILVGAGLMIGGPVAKLSLRTKRDDRVWKEHILTHQQHHLNPDWLKIERKFYLYNITNAEDLSHDPSIRIEIEESGPLCLLRETKKLHPQFSEDNRNVTFHRFTRHHLLDNCSSIDPHQMFTTVSASFASLLQKYGGPEGLRAAVMSNYMKGLDHLLSNEITERLIAMSLPETLVSWFWSSNGKERRRCWRSHDACGGPAEAALPSRSPQIPEDIAEQLLNPLYDFSVTNPQQWKFWVQALEDREAGFFLENFWNISMDVQKNVSSWLKNSWKSYMVPYVLLGHVDPGYPVSPKDLGYIQWYSLQLTSPESNREGPSMKTLFSWRFPFEIEFAKFQYDRKARDYLSLVQTRGIFHGVSEELPGLTRADQWMMIYNQPVKFSQLYNVSESQTLQLSGEVTSTTYVFTCVTEWSTYVYEELLKYMYRGGDRGLFRRRSVRDILFGGSRDPLSTFLEPGVTYRTFVESYRSEEEAENSYTVETVSTGEAGTKANELHVYNGMSSPLAYHDAPKNISIYIPQIFRRVNYVYDREENTDGISSRRYVPERNEFEVKNPRNLRFLSAIDGLYNLSTAVLRGTDTPVPLYLSEPRLNNVDKVHQTRVSTLYHHTSDAKESNYIDVDPITGRTMSLKNSWQFHIQIEPDVFVPIFLMEEQGNVTKKYLGEWKERIDYPETYGQALFVSLLPLGVVSFVLGSVLVVLSCICR
ncbi:hypothetical protein PROFUN_03130 [Planoprotostelium fungivorum]|uniref:Uncharacterized protein n=1 Tax=Planoprotostelium fungivorum TaxID=1890364 RepID=A0A2P6NQB2_9EUKA|nr:hypothetical protein PROFUN_03130 [Planoprotostelium fungivorum]